MNRRQFLYAAGAAAIMPMSALGQAGAMDPVFADVVANRNNYGQVIHLFGDSIMRGYGLGGFADQLPTSTPAYAFRSIASTARLAFADNGLPIAIGYGSALSAANLTTYVNNGVIRFGDVVVLEDAGDHGSNPDAYEAMWVGLRTALANAGVTCIMMTMFDYVAQFNPQLGIGYQYDVVMPGYYRTINDATRAAAAANIAGVGAVKLIEMNAIMDACRSWSLSNHGVDLMHLDGIHPNAWGQMVMAGEILKAAGCRPCIKTVLSAITVGRVYYQSLNYGAPNFTEDLSEQYVKWWLLR